MVRRHSTSSGFFLAAACTLLSACVGIMPRSPLHGAAVGRTPINVKMETDGLGLGPLRAWAVHYQDGAVELNIPSPSFESVTSSNRFEQGWIGACRRDKNPPDPIMIISATLRSADSAPLKAIVVEETPTQGVAARKGVPWATLSGKSLPPMIPIGSYLEIRARLNRGDTILGEGKVAPVFHDNTSALSLLPGLTAHIAGISDNAYRTTKDHKKLVVRSVYVDISNNTPHSYKSLYYSVYKYRSAFNVIFTRTYTQVKGYPLVWGDELSPVYAYQDVSVTTEFPADFGWAFEREFDASNRVLSERFDAANKYQWSDNGTATRVIPGVRYFQLDVRLAMLSVHVDELFAKLSDYVVVDQKSTFKKFECNRE